MNPESWTKKLSGFFMSRKYRKKGYAERLKYMHMLEDGYSIDYIVTHHGISHHLLGFLWTKYQSEGPSGLIKKKNIQADYEYKLKVLRDIEENHLTLVDASLKYYVSASQICVWRRIVKTKGYEALAEIKPRGRPPKNDMGRPRKKKPAEMTELELLRYENECLKAENALLKKVKALVEERDAHLRGTGRKPSTN